MTGLQINIYRPNYGDCTNGGVSAPGNAKGKTFIVFDEKIQDGNHDLEECQANPNKYVCLKIVRRYICGALYMHLEPITPCDGQHIGYMHGGNYGGTSDSRFRKFSPYPLPLHDRSETPEQYDLLTR